MTSVDCGKMAHSEDLYKYGLKDHMMSYDHLVWAPPGAGANYYCGKFDHVIMGDNNEYYAVNPRCNRVHVELFFTTHEGVKFEKYRYKRMVEIARLKNNTVLYPEFLSTWNYISVLMNIKHSLNNRRQPSSIRQQQILNSIKYGWHYITDSQKHWFNGQRKIYSRLANTLRVNPVIYEKELLCGDYYEQNKIVVENYAKLHSTKVFSGIWDAEHSD